MNSIIFRFNGEKISMEQARAFEMLTTDPASGIERHIHIGHNTCVNYGDSKDRTIHSTQHAGVDTGKDLW